MAYGVGTSYGRDDQTSFHATIDRDDLGVLGLIGGGQPSKQQASSTPEKSESTLLSDSGSSIGATFGYHVTSRPSQFSVGRVEHTWVSASRTGEHRRLVTNRWLCKLTTSCVPSTKSSSSFRRTLGTGLDEYRVLKGFSGGDEAARICWGASCYQGVLVAEHLGRLTQELVPAGNLGRYSTVLNSRDPLTGIDLDPRP
jgi:hypothetical protein